MPSRNTTERPTTVADMNYRTVYMACGEPYNYALAGERVSDSWDIRYDYERKTSGHYFNPDTLRWFGSRNFKTVAQGVSVELQTNAPEDRYKVQVWLDNDGAPDPAYGCRHATRREAVKCAKDTAGLLMSVRPVPDLIA